MMASQSTTLPCASLGSSTNWRSSVIRSPTTWW
uniref:Uncharacterized protein n=1 Tax=Arundo donax TaxID=35708 RepID=A0A0A9GNL1_ARUDO